MLLCTAYDPGVRLRDIAARVGVTERTAYGIVTDLTEAGYVVKHKDGRRNRYQIQAHLPLSETDADHGAAKPGTDRPQDNNHPRRQREKAQPLEHLRTRRSPGSAVTASLMPDAKYPRRTAVSALNRRRAWPRSVTDPGTPHGSAARLGHWCRRGAARSHQSMVSASAVMRSRRPAMNST